MDMELLKAYMTVHIYGVFKKPGGKGKHWEELERSMQFNAVSGAKGYKRRALHNQITLIMVETGRWNRSDARELTASVRMIRIGRTNWTPQ